MRSQLSAIAIVVCVVLGTQQTVSAQGTFGNVNANNRTFSSNSSYRSTSNYGGTAVAGGGSAVSDLGGRELDLGQSSPSSGSMLFPLDQFRVGNRQAGQFVGTSLFDPGSFVGAATAGGMSAGSSFGGRMPQGQGALGRSMPAATGRGMTSPGVGSGGAKAVRAAARLAFDAPQIDLGRINASLARRLQQPGPVRNRLPVEATVDGRTATLRGQVATEYDRILAERFVRMEPGIEQVANELTVARSSKDTPPAAELPLVPPQEN